MEWKRVTGGLGKSARATGVVRAQANVRGDQEVFLQQEQVAQVTVVLAAGVMRVADVFAGIAERFGNCGLGPAESRAAEPRRAAVARK